MALAAASSVTVDSSAPAAGLAAASIAAPRILGSPAAQQQAGSSPGVLLCTVGLTGSHSGIQLSSAPADIPAERAPSHLTATAAAVQIHSFPDRSHVGLRTLPVCLGSSSGLQKPSSRQMATVARVAQAAGDGYMVHPAAADSSLHLGAVVREEGNAPSRVPVGLGAYSAQKSGEIPSVYILDT